MAYARLPRDFQGRHQVGRPKRQFQRGECCTPNQFLPGLPGSGSGHGSRRPHRFNAPHDSLPEQHKRVAGAPGGNRVGHGPAGPRGARRQRRRLAPHFVKRVVPECPPPGGREPDPAPAFNCLPLWAPIQCPNLTTPKTSGPRSTPTIPADHLE